MKKASDLGEKGVEIQSVEDQLENEKPWQDELEFFEQFKDKVLIKHLKGPLFFGYTGYLKSQVATIEQDIQALIIRMDKVPTVDQSGLYALEDIILELEMKKSEGPTRQCTGATDGYAHFN